MKRMVHALLLSVLFLASTNAFGDDKLKKTSKRPVRCSNVILAAEMLAKISSHEAFTNSAPVLLFGLTDDSDPRAKSLRAYRLPMEGSRPPAGVLIEAVKYDSRRLAIELEMCAKTDRQNCSNRAAALRAALFLGSLPALAALHLLPTPFNFVSSILLISNVALLNTSSGAQFTKNLVERLPAQQVDLESVVQKFEAALYNQTESWWGFTHRGHDFDWGIVWFRDEPWLVTALTPQREK